MLSVADKVIGCVAAYERGTITLAEAIVRVLASLSKSDAPLDIVNSLSQEWQQRICDDIDTAPNHESEWNRIELLTIGTCAGGISDLQTQRKLSLIASYRAGVESLRIARR